MKSLGVSLTFALFLIGCSSDTPVSPSSLAGGNTDMAATTASGPAGHHHATNTSALSSADVHKGIAEVRRLLAPFHNLDKAIEYGYDVPVGCVSDPARGGMGYHYGRSDRDLVGDGVVNLLEPEFLVYSPTTDGQMRLSAVDYFVPFSTWSDPEPPSLLGVPFAAEEGFNAWVLHIWAFWPNPAGIFENYNPAVPLCP